LTFLREKKKKRKDEKKKEESMLFIIVLSFFLSFIHSFVRLFVLGRYVHCIDARWLYAVEKHLASIMSSFICTDSHDEKILIEILSSYTRETRSTIFVQAFAEHVHDVSGTLKHIKQANLLSMHQVLRIDNTTVECVLIDDKKIEATILVDDLEQAKRIRASNILSWNKIHHKVRQVTEAWTLDGSNIKFGNAFRIYTNDKQLMKYFLSSSMSTETIEQVHCSLKQLNQQIDQTNDELRIIRQRRVDIVDDLNKIKQIRSNDKKKLANAILVGYMSSKAMERSSRSSNANKRIDRVKTLFYIYIDTRIDQVHLNFPWDH
jgi:hypothetical protein